MGNCITGCCRILPEKNIPSQRSRPVSTKGFRGSDAGAALPASFMARMDYKRRSSLRGRYVVVKPRITTNGPTPIGDGEQMPAEEAVCRFCSRELKEGNALKKNCRCPTTLTHEECSPTSSTARGNDRCVNCRQEIQIVPVTLFPGTISATKKEVQKRNLFSIFKR